MSGIEAGLELIQGGSVQQRLASDVEVDVDAGGLEPMQIGSGTLHIEKLATANDGYVFVTTGGVNPSSAYLLSTTQHAFFAINHALSLVEDSPLAELYFGNPGVSGNGSGTGAIAMTLTPDGGALVIAGVSGVYVQPTPRKPSYDPC